MSVLDESALSGVPRICTDRIADLQVSFSKRDGACMRFLQSIQIWRLRYVCKSHRAPQSAVHSQQALLSLIRAL